ncbi:MAG TPA: efflux RND transporter periplasmic adaptor subunit [Rhizomicrobium sp.]|jgi:multidrug efflux system membrane fusion protein|nr:efflux RND transporter periplasmic adaptor subunit [Rhizomicrobium sp.]
MFRERMQALRRWWEQNQPNFWRSMKPRYRAAAVIALVVVAWLGTGFLSGKDAAAVITAKPTASDIPRVRVAQLVASPRAVTITIRGQTQALHAVDVRAQVDGIVRAIHFEKGDAVKAGDVLCELMVNDRQAKLDEATALVSQRSKENDAAQNLMRQGAMSVTGAKQAQAALESAVAAQRTQQIELANTKIRAPYDGFVDDRYVDAGDFMRAGDKCEMVIAPEPFLVVGAVSEREVSQIQIGDPASATLVSGQTVTGKVRFLASKADDTTRTFRIEIELPNSDNKLRSGVSADIHVPVRNLNAQKISPGILVLDDNGVVGVRAVINNRVHFQPVEIVSDDPDGMWVTGLPNKMTVITVGQEFVIDGERVIPVAGGKAGSAS